MANIADAAHDQKILRLENLDTDILPPKIDIDTTIVPLAKRKQ